MPGPGRFLRGGLVAGLLVAVLGSSAARTAVAAGQGLDLTPISGPPGTPVTVSGPAVRSCQGAGADITISWDGSPVGGGTSFVVPAGAREGRHRVVIACSGDPDGIGGVTDSGRFRVVAAENTSGDTTGEPADTALRLAPDSVEPGRSVRLTWTGFPLRCTPRATIAGARAALDGGGGSGSVTVPEGLDPGPVPVVLRCGGERADATLRVLDPAEPGGQDEPDGPDGRTDLDSLIDRTGLIWLIDRAGLPGVGDLLRGAVQPAVPGPGGNPDRPDFPRALPTPAELSWRPLDVLSTLLTFGFLFLVVGFPAELFNKTLEENRHRLLRWWTPEPRTADEETDGPARSRWRGAVAFTLLAAVLMTAVERDAGFDLPTVVLAVALLLAVPLGTLVYAGAAELVLRRAGRTDGPVTLRVVGAGVLTAAVCVLLSRAAGFVPGYVYGLFVVVAAAPALAARRARLRGPAVLVAPVVLLTVGTAAWFAWPRLDALAERPGASLAVLVADSALAVTFVLAVQGVAFGLLPITWLDGRTLRDWNRWAWTVVWAAACLLLVHALFPKFLREFTSVGQLAAALAPFVFFGVVSTGLWGYLRITARKPDPAPDPAPGPGPTPSG